MKFTKDEIQLSLQKKKKYCYECKYVCLKQSHSEDATCEWEREQAKLT